MKQADFKKILELADNLHVELMGLEDELFHEYDNIVPVGIDDEGEATGHLYAPKHKPLPEFPDMDLEPIHISVYAHTDTGSVQVCMKSAIQSADLSDCLRLKAFLDANIKARMAAGETAPDDEEK